MENRTDDLSALLPLARAGVGAAAAQLRSALEPQVVRMVRHVLRSGERASPLGRAVWACADAHGPTERTAPLIARELCDRLLERLCPAVGETRLRPETTLI